MSKTLVLSPAVMLTIVLSVVPAAGGFVWWMSDLSTRLVAMEGKISASDTGQLNDRLTQAEERIQFNNESIRETTESIEKLDVEMADMEDKLSAWMERELAKVYNIINDNPLGN
jgi:predicted  nucleic acid-binding Zn-ribbon protein